MLKNILAIAATAVLFSSCSDDDKPDTVLSTWKVGDASYTANIVTLTTATRTVQATTSAGNNLIIYFPYVPAGTDTFYVTGGAAGGRQAAVVAYVADSMASFTAVTHDSTVRILTSVNNDRLIIAVPELKAEGASSSDTVTISGSITTP